SVRQILKSRLNLAELLCEYDKRQALSILNDLNSEDSEIDADIKRVLCMAGDRDACIKARDMFTKMHEVDKKAEYREKLDRISRLIN
ncbi:MAG: hypothetical protein R6U41_08385, partial [Desulfosalsimonas sp.]|uniref:hypothetical protein n=1 Tax=Desulfosalsimonas sp. TaxID=3073848 RepID=UPI003970F51A